MCQRNVTVEEFQCFACRLTGDKEEDFVSVSSSEWPSFVELPSSAWHNIEDLLPENHIDPVYWCKKCYKSCKDKVEKRVFYLKYFFRDDNPNSNVSPEAEKCTVLCKCGSNDFFVNWIPASGGGYLKLTCIQCSTSEVLYDDYS